MVLKFIKKRVRRIVNLIIKTFNRDYLKIVLLEYYCTN